VVGPEGMEERDAGEKIKRRGGNGEGTEEGGIEPMLLGDRRPWSSIKPFDLMPTGK